MTQAICHVLAPIIDYNVQFRDAPSSSPFSKSYAALATKHYRFSNLIVLVQSKLLWKLR